MTPATSVLDPGVAHLLGRLAVVEHRIRRAVAARRAGDPDPDDPFRGLYLSDDAVDRLLDRVPATPGRDERPDADLTALVADVERVADRAAARGARLRLREVERGFALTALDVEILLVALACDVEARFESLFGYLNDDVTRRRPSVAVVLELCGSSLTSAEDRGRLVHGPLVHSALVSLEDPERPFPGRLVRVSDRVVSHLLGDDRPALELVPALVDLPAPPWGDPEPLAGAMAGGVVLAYLREPPTGSGRAVAARALAECRWGALQVDLGVVARDPAPVELARLVAREAVLQLSGVVAGPAEALAGNDRLLTALRPDTLPLVLVGNGPWDGGWTASVPLLLEVENSTAAERAALWRRALGPRADEVDASAATSQFLLRPEQVLRAAHTAIAQADVADDRLLTAEHLRLGARSENGSALQHLARRVRPGVGWEDIVLPASTELALREVSLRARHRERVLGEWRMRPGGGRGVGVAALLAGDSGTGKTMSAEVVAGDLGLDLYVVDLATVVDKYVGETEKNLERIFTAAAGVNGVLLFDEADAVFGKRSEVRDAHDRYANVESAYLLQRMESFDGLVILATNLRANIDEAFTRRLDVIVDFALPDARQRLALWHRCLGDRLPRSNDLDLAFCADAFELSGGGIRSAAVTAAYLAADQAGWIGMTHVVTAVQREYRKLGRLCLEHEFGPYHALVC